MNVLCAGKTLPVFSNFLLACYLLFSLDRALNCLDWDTCSKVTSIEEFQVFVPSYSFKKRCKKTLSFCLFVKSFLRSLFETNKIE